MYINIQSLHFTANPLLEEYVTEKVNKLPRLNDRITSCNVYLKLDHSQKGDNKVCELNVHIPGNVLFVKRAAHTFEEATNEATHAMQEQLRGVKA